MEILLSVLAGMSMGWLASSSLCTMRNAKHMHKAEGMLGS